MKKLTATFVIISLFILAGCISVTATKEQEKTLEKVYEFRGMKKTELYNKSLSYIARTYNSANDVIQLKDPESGQIVCKGIGTINAGFGIKYYFSYTFIIDVKDGKIRTRFENISGQNIGNTPAPDVNRYWEDIVSDVERVRSGLYSSINSSKSDDSW